VSVDLVEVLLQLCLVLQELEKHVLGFIYMVGQFVFSVVGLAALRGCL
jgi:hypothetical protein